MENDGITCPILVELGALFGARSTKEMKMSRGFRWAQNWRLRFLGLTLVHRFRCPFAHTLNWCRLNQTLIHYFHPYHIRNISPASIKHLILPSISYCPDKTSRLAGTRRSCLPSLSFPLMKIRIVPAGNHL
jgi:hypothetical protein